MKIIDPHLHFFDLSEGDYHWLKPENPPFWPDKPLINKEFGVDDLTLSKPLELAGFVHIEAGFNNQHPELELAWLQQRMDKAQNAVPYKAVAGFDLTSPLSKNAALISKLQSFKSFIGVRDILDDDAEQILYHSNCQSNFELLNKHQLIFEAQLPLPNLTATKALTEIIAYFPSVQFVINHAGFAPIKENEQGYKLWQQGLNLLSPFENCTIKCSGWEMVERGYSKKHIEQVISDAIKTFGEERVMLASNFPLTLFSKSYQQLWQNYNDLPVCSSLLEKILYQNAQRIYRLG